MAGRATNPFPALPDLGYNAILCRYNEIATKGANRSRFEDLFVQSIRRLLKDVGPWRVVQERGRVFLCPRDRGAVLNRAQYVAARDRLPRVAGLASASPGFLLEPDFEAIREAALAAFPRVYEAVAASTPPPTPITYCGRARRNDKSFPLSSHEMEVRLADELLDRFPRLRIDLRHGTIRLEIEVRRQRAFVCFERIAGPGGLPAGSGGRVLALLSGGIDSPVACYQMMRRGCRVDYVTFHSSPYTPPALLAKVASLARILNRYQGEGRLFAVNLLEAQKQIRDRCRERLRTVLYRRLMMRVAGQLAAGRRAAALVTGDNLGQVASQTLTNLAVITEASPLLVLRPLLAADKHDTVALAEDIGTMAESRFEVPDSCTVFAPRNPATAANRETVRREEARLDVEELLVMCAAATRRVDLDTLEEFPVANRVAKPTVGGCRKSDVSS